MGTPLAAHPQGRNRRTGAAAEATAESSAEAIEAPADTAAEAPSGNVVEIVSLSYGWQPDWIGASYLVPLSEEASPPDQIHAEFSPMVEASFFDGKLYTLPTAVRTLARSTPCTL